MPTHLELLETIRRHGNLKALDLPAAQERALYAHLAREGSILRTRDDALGFYDLTAAGVRVLNRLLLEPLTLKVA